MVKWEALVTGKGSSFPENYGVSIANPTPPPDYAFTLIRNVPYVGPGLQGFFNYPSPDAFRTMVIPDNASNFDVPSRVNDIQWGVAIRFYGAVDLQKLAFKIYYTVV